MSVLYDYITRNFVYTDDRLLPLIHSCGGYEAYLIISDDKLKTQLCPVFNENLLYFFYGKPSYPPTEKIKINTASSSFNPVCFIIDVEKIKPKKIFPFDSGAFMSKRYERYIHRKTQIEHYLIDDKNGILKYISVVYGSNKNYMFGEIFDKLPPHQKPELTSLFDLLKSDNVEEYDERANTIEIISDESYVLSDIVKCVILPDSLLKNDTVNEWLKNTVAKCKTYETRRLCPPNRYNEVIFQKVIEYFKEEGYIK
ncbi:MAG: hypothetical protein NC213_10500 [Acetobacter sp.]|nr:hypothetical protein [Bacteroides sp.]MCM1342165.1 hypothetical protein [Acetobacter sp.]MCM1433156.1 hypothetical protein [Clostridiales bacterium]